jgi:deazaflavin-dependent oxidoreductase (nitroreductase family)
MPVDKLPGGTRGTRTPPSLLSRIMTPLMVRIHRRAGDQFGGMDLLYLTTVGARSGARRTAPVARFDDGQGGWIIVASAGGAAQHPGWYHNIAAHPEQVRVEVSGKEHDVRVDQLEGEQREKAWALVVERAPRFQGYLSKTDRQLPVLRLTPVS